MEYGKPIEIKKVTSWVIDWAVLSDLMVDLCGVEPWLLTFEYKGEGAHGDLYMFHDREFTADDQETIDHFVTNDNEALYLDHVVGQFILKLIADDVLPAGNWIVSFPEA